MEQNFELIQEVVLILNKIIGQDNENNFNAKSSDQSSIDQMYKQLQLVSHGKEYQNYMQKFVNENTKENPQDKTAKLRD